MIIDNILQPATPSVHGDIPRMLARELAARRSDNPLAIRDDEVFPITSSGSTERVSAEEMQRVWLALNGLEENESIGLDVCKHLRPGMFNALLFSMMTSKNLLDALHRLKKYFRVISTAEKISIKRDLARVYLSVERPYIPEATALPSIDNVTGLILSSLRTAAGYGINPVRAELQRVEPNDTAAFKLFFGCNLTYDSRQTILVFDKVAIMRNLPIANKRLAEANEQVVELYINRNIENNIVSRVSSAILELMPSGDPHIKDVADKIGVGERKLQRQLHNEGVNYSELVNSLRIRLSKSYLKQTWRSIGEISRLLGYSEPANFSRSFKRLVGVSPNAYRKSKQSEYR